MDRATQRIIHRVKVQKLLKQIRALRRDVKYLREENQRLRDELAAKG